VLLGRLDQAIVRPPLQKLEEDEISKLKQALVAAGLQN
jgi:dihydrodipicolinate synthase/N-acetylneuraminate lyase